MSLVHFTGSSDDIVLDANLHFFSSRMTITRSAMGIYDAYQRTRQATPTQAGTWFAGHTTNGSLVGLATCCPGNSTDALPNAGNGHQHEGSGCARVDCFVHRSFLSEWHVLLEAATSWAKQHGFTSCRARVARDDADKHKRFLGAGFVPTPNTKGPGASATAPFILTHSVGSDTVKFEAIELQLLLM